MPGQQKYTDASHYTQTCFCTHWPKWSMSVNKRINCEGVRLKFKCLEERERENKPYNKRNHRDEEQTVGNLVGEERLSFAFREQLTFLKQQVYEGKEHPIDHSLASKRAEKIRYFKL